MLHPAPPNYGYKFRTGGLRGEDEVIIDATIDNVTSTNRCTTLTSPTNPRFSVITVEHILAALRGMGIDNCLIDVVGPEIPIMDGSALLFCEYIRRAGIEEETSRAEREYFPLNDYCYNNDFRLSVSVDFTLWSRALGFQVAKMEGLEQFEKEIAPARTFALADDVSQLKGVKRDENTILFDVETNEWDNLPFMRFDDEIARHKLLDVVGDLALFGRPFFSGSLHMDKPGHTKNITFARELRVLQQQQRHYSQ